MILSTCCALQNYIVIRNSQGGNNSCRHLHLSKQHRQHEQELHIMLLSGMVVHKPIHSRVRQLLHVQAAKCQHIFSICQKPLHVAFSPLTKQKRQHNENFKYSEAKTKKAKTKTKKTEAKTNLLFVAGSKKHKDLQFLGVCDSATHFRFFKTEKSHEHGRAIKPTYKAYSHKKPVGVVAARYEDMALNASF